MFDPVMYTVLEDAGHVTLTASTEGNLVISAFVTITTSPHNATARGSYMLIMALSMIM